MASILNHAARYANASREELLDLLEKLLVDQDTYGDKIANFAIEVSIQRVDGYNNGYRMGYWDCWRKFSH
jgi:hypothetical protein